MCVVVSLCDCHGCYFRELVVNLIHMKIYKPLIFVLVGAVIIGFLYWISKPNYSPVTTNEIAPSVKLNCENFAMTNGLDTFYLPINCVQEIGNGESPVNLTIFASTTNDNQGELHISRNGKDIFVTDGEFISFSDQEKLSLTQGSFDFEDVTFDGYKDLVIQTAAGAYNFTHAYFAYNPKTKTFNTVPVVEATNESFDPIKKQMVSFFKGRGIGDIYTEETYEFRNGKYVLIMDFDQSTVDNGRDDNINPMYTQVTRKLIDGKMVEVEKKSISYKELYGDQN